jgi:hypothetical protein
MKTLRINRTARLTGMTIALALLAGAAGELKAQNGAKGGATKLLELSGGLVTPISEPSNYKPMACAKCKDNFSYRVDWAARGANKPTVLVPKHLCDACATAISVEGHGKAKHDVVTHKCGSCGAAALACCNTKKGSEVATKGMEKKFEIAPLK